MAQHPTYPPSESRPRPQRATSSYSSSHSTSQASYPTDYATYGVNSSDQSSFQLQQGSTIYHFPPPPQSSSQTSPSVLRPTITSPVLQTFVLPHHQHETISPTALYQHQSHHTLLEAPPGNRSAGPSPTSSSFPTYSLDGDSYPLRPHDTLLPSPHPSLPPHPVSSSSAVPSGTVGDPEGWSTEATEPSLADSDPALSVPNSSSRQRTVSFSNSKKKIAPPPAALPPRKRSPASCLFCRKKKLKCDRSLPCSSCIAKGTECIWEGDATPLYTHKDDNDAKELRAQVDRLQTLLDSLAGSPSSAKTTLLLQHSASGSVEGPPPDLLPPLDLLSQDLSQALVEIAFEGTLPHQEVGGAAFAPQGRNGDAFVDEARQFVSSRSRFPPLNTTNLVTPSSSSSEHSPSSVSYPSIQTQALRSSTILLGSTLLQRRRSSVASIIDNLPSMTELEPAIRHYTSSFHPYLPVLQLAAFERQASALQQVSPEQLEVDTVSIALVLAVAAAGLQSMTDQQAKEAGMFANRTTTIAQWSNGAVSAVVAGKFPEQPDLDSVRTCLILSAVHLASKNVDSYTSATSLLTLATQAAFALELNRDPVRNGKTKYGFAECQDRRRLFWCLFVLCSSLSTDTSRLWPQFDLRQIDCQYPLSCYDDELQLDELAVRVSVRARQNSNDAEETPMTLTLCRAELALVTKKISDTAFAASGCRYHEVISLDLDLRKIEKSLPECYRLSFDNDGQARFSSPSTPTEIKAAFFHLALSSEIVRLNRPFLVLGGSDETYQHSRERAVKHAKRMLFLATSPACRSMRADLGLKALSAATVLSIEILQAPEEPDVDQIKSALALADEQLEKQARQSPLYQRGAGVVQFLRKQIADITPSVPRRAKRARTARYSPDDVTVPSTKSTLSDWNRSDLQSTIPSRLGSPDSDYEVMNRRRKVKRPTFNSARSEGHIPTRAHFAAAPPPVLRTHRSHSADDLPDPSTLTDPLSPALRTTLAPSINAFTPVVVAETSRSRTQSDSTSLRSSGLPNHSPSSPYNTYDPSNRLSHAFSQHRQPVMDVGLGLESISGSSIYQERDNSPFFGLQQQQHPVATGVEDLVDDRRRSRFHEQIQQDGYSFEDHHQYGH